MDVLGAGGWQMGQHLQHAQIDEAMAIDHAGGQAQAPDQVLPVRPVGLIMRRALRPVLSRAMRPSDARHGVSCNVHA